MDYFTFYYFLLFYFLIHVNISTIINAWPWRLFRRERAGERQEGRQGVARYINAKSPGKYYNIYRI